MVSFCPFSSHTYLIYLVWVTYCMCYGMTHFKRPNKQHITTLSMQQISLHQMQRPYSLFFQHFLSLSLSIIVFDCVCVFFCSIEPNERLNETKKNNVSFLIKTIHSNVTNHTTKWLFVLRKTRQTLLKNDEKKKTIIFFSSFAERSAIK